MHSGQEDTIKATRSGRAGLAVGTTPDDGVTVRVFVRAIGVVITVTVVAATVTVCLTARTVRDEATSIADGILEYCKVIGWLPEHANES